MSKSTWNFQDSLGSRLSGAKKRQLSNVGSGFEVKCIEVPNCGVQLKSVL